MKKKKKKLYCAFIDFAKAFDTVWRNGLWNKLLINQINGKMYNVIFNMYQNIKSRIQYNKETSNYFECNVTFVLLELTFSFHKLQYFEKLSSCICISTAESANKTVSSAYSITNILIKISSSFSISSVIQFSPKELRGIPKRVFDK
jgi:hypothetical protein